MQTLPAWLEIEVVNYACHSASPSLPHPSLPPAIFSCLPQPPPSLHPLLSFLHLCPFVPSFLQLLFPIPPSSPPITLPFYLFPTSLVYPRITVGSFPSPFYLPQSVTNFSLRITICHYLITLPSNPFHSTSSPSPPPDLIPSSASLSTRPCFSFFLLSTLIYFFFLNAFLLQSFLCTHFTPKSILLQHSQNTELHTFTPLPASSQTLNPTP